MTHEEFKEQFTQLISNPDTMQANAPDFLKAVEEDYTTLETMRETHAADEKRIADLQNTNQKLFLSVTGTIKDEPEQHEPDPGIDWNSIIEAGGKKNGES